MYILSWLCTLHISNLNIIYEEIFFKVQYTMKKMLYAVKITSYLGAYKLWKLLIVKTVHWLCFINCIMMCNVHRLFIQIEHHCMTINTILGAVVREYWGQVGRLPSSTVTWSRGPKESYQNQNAQRQEGVPSHQAPHQLSFPFWNNWKEGLPLKEYVEE